MSSTMDKRESDIWKWAISAILLVIMTIAGCSISEKEPYDKSLELKKVEKTILDAKNKHELNLERIEAQKELKLKLIEKGITKENNVHTIVL